ncbi:MAG: hypothetical protein AAGH79_12595 [Bacteroidota bacterium]
MKQQTWWIATLLLGSCVFFTSCQKEEIIESDPDLVIQEPTEEEVVELLEVAFSSQASGLTQEAIEAAEHSEQYIEKTGESPCGLTFDSIASFTVDRPNIQASYTTEWEWTIYCNSLNLPTNMDFNRTGEGSFETTRFTGEDTAVSGFEINNLLSGPNLDISGVYTRSGVQASKVGDQNTFNYLINLSLHQLLIQKFSWEVVSGDGTFDLMGSTSTGASYNIEGTYVLSPNGTVTVTVNGNIYTFNW